MAIQHRRGAYADFNPAKLLPGELAVVLSGDPASNTGRSLYICFAPGVVKRIVSYEDFENELQNVTEELQNAFTADIRSAISSAITATNTANAATKAADAATKAANEAAAAANAYVMGDISGKKVTFETAAERAGVQSGDTLAVAFGKLAKLCADLQPYAFELPINNLESEDAESPLAASMGKELAGRIGDLASLPTADKSNLVAAFREQNANISKYSLNGRLITGTQLTGRTAGAYNERTIAGLSAFAEVRVFVAIGDCVVQWLLFDSEQTEQTLTGYYSQQYSATVAFKCVLSTGTIGVKVIRTIGWTEAQHRIIKVVAISKK